MNISSVNSGQMQVNMLRMGELLKNVTARQMNVENKLVKMAVTEQVTNSGNNIDIKA